MDGGEWFVGNGRVVWVSARKGPVVIDGRPTDTLRWRQAGISFVWLSLASWYDVVGLYISVALSTIVFTSACIVAIWFRDSTVEFWMHMAAAFLHSGSALALSIVVITEDSNWQSALTRTISSWQAINDTSKELIKGDIDCSDVNQTCFMTTRNAMIGDVMLPLVDIIVLAALVSASYHIAITASRRELSFVEDGSSKARWKDYSMSASAILVVVAALSGITDVFMLGLIAVVQWFLLSQTPYIEDPGTTSDQGLRFIEYFATFVAIMVPIVYSFASAFEENPKPPDAIVVIILAIALFYLSFVVVFVYKMMIPDRYREAEVFYVSLSFVTKTSLHWLLFSGTTARNDRVYTSKEAAEQNTGKSAADTDYVAVGLSLGVPVILGCLLALYFYKWSASTRAIKPRQNPKACEYKMVENMTPR